MKSVIGSRALPPDPAPQNDLAGKPIQIGLLSLARWARGPVQGTFTIIDLSHEITHSRRFTDLPKCKNLKQAVRPSFSSRANVKWRLRRRCAPSVRPSHLTCLRVSVALAAAADSGGGFGGGFVPFAERTYPEPGSMTWKTCITLYAQTGRWPKTADLIWGEGRPDDGKIPEGFEKRPERLEREAAEARAEFLEAEAAEKEKAVDDPAALANLEKLGESDRILINEILEHFGGTLTSVVPAGERKGA